MGVFLNILRLFGASIPNANVVFEYSTRPVRAQRRSARC